jgi:hypothetical protein
MSHPSEASCYLIVNTRWSGFGTGERIDIVALLAYPATQRLQQFSITYTGPEEVGYDSWTYLVCCELGSCLLLEAM